MGKVSTTNLDSEKRSLNIQICGIVADPVHAVTKRNLNRDSTLPNNAWDALLHVSLTLGVNAASRQRRSAAPLTAAPHTNPSRRPHASVVLAKEFV